MNEDLIGWILIIYFLIIPYICNLMRQDEKELSFSKWYIKKSDNVNWLGYSVFFLLGSGSFIYVLLYLLMELFLYVVILPACWLFEFLFLNKECSHIVCEALEEKLKEEPNTYKGWELTERKCKTCGTFTTIKVEDLLDGNILNTTMEYPIYSYCTVCHNSMFSTLKYIGGK